MGGEGIGYVLFFENELNADYIFKQETKKNSAFNLSSECDVYAF